MMRTFLVAMLLGPACIAAAPPRLIERYDAAIELERQSKWDDALAGYLRVMDEFGSELVAADASNKLFRPAKLVILDHIATTIELRNRYQSRFDAQIERQLKIATDRKDRAALAQIALSYTPCRAASLAHISLGDFAFEAADFAAARHHWQSATNVAGAQVGQIRAKELLAELAMGWLIDAKLDEYRKQFPSARGWLAGHDGEFAQTLLELKDSEQFKAKNPHGPAIPDAAPKLVGEPISLPTEGGNLFSQPMYQPVIWRDHALMSSGYRVLAFDLAKCEFVDAFRLPEEETHIIPRQLQMHAGESIAVDGDRAFARIGTVQHPATHLVCLECDRESEKFHWRATWQIRVSQLAGPGPGTLKFDGCPLVDSGKLYCTWSRIVGDRMTISAAAFALDRLDRGPIWKRTIAELDDARHDYPPMPLVRAGSNVICAAVGQITAFDAESGDVAWAVRYTPRKNIRTPLGGLCTLDGQVFVAPADTNEIFGLDAWTGAALWRFPTLDGARLLGAAQQRLIVTSDGPYAGIAAFDTSTGLRVPKWGSLASDHPVGRGLIAGDRIIWPTERELKIIKLDGTLEYPPAVFMTIAGGNLVFGDGYLLVAGADQMHVLKYPESESK